VETGLHKILNIFEHVYPYIAGFILTMFALTKLWLRDRKETKKRIGTLEVMAEHMVTQEDLQECRDEVRHVDEQNLEKIYDEIKANTKENAQQHQDISNNMVDMMKQIVRLHK